MTTSRAQESPEQAHIRREADNEATRSARAQETPDQSQRRREANTSAMRYAHAHETPDQSRRRRGADNETTRNGPAEENPDLSRRRRETVNDATIVRRRIGPAVHSAVSTAEYVDFGNMDFECKNCRAFLFIAERKVGSQRPIQSSLTVVKVKSALHRTFRCSKIRRRFSESCLLGPHLSTKGSARILLSIKMLCALLRCTQTG